VYLTADAVRRDHPDLAVVFRRRAIASAVAAGAVATLVAILVVLGAGALLLVPSLVWLLILVQRGTLAGEH
jgi:hypothetical protein